MKQFTINVSFCLLIAFAACKSKDNKTESQTTTTEQTTANETSTSENAPTENTNARWEARKAKGDTLAMPYKDLEAYLPDINGYTKEGGAKGSQMNMPGMGSVSQGEQNYVNGDKHVSIKLVDYNSSYQTFQGLTAMYGMAFSMEDDTKKQNKVDLGNKDVAAYQTVYKTEKKAEMVIVAAGRFIINIDVNGENDEAFLKNVAKSINLNKMAEL